MQRVAEMVGIQGYQTTTSYWRGTDETDVPVGSASMTRFAIVRRFRRIPSVSAVQMIWGHTNNIGNGGWFLRVAANDFINFQVRGSASTYSATDAFWSLNTTYAEILIIGVSYDGSNLRMLINGNATTVPTAVGGYTAPPAGREVTIGADQAGVSPLRDLSIVALIGSDQVALDANGLAAAETQIRADLKNGRGLESAFVAADLTYYDGRDAVQNGQVKSTWAPRVGAGITVDRNGQLQPASYPART